ncbi:Peptidase C55 [Pseudomonas syringae pv. philadelphi]|uniref:Peptidase C55 n=1 Tax=Pseudomonas syringae pv. philadelphi TaxID=251706 RepID=A0A3M3ZS34_9PSED|nr:YopJ family type III secretion system effector XopJ [Pseudomonas syringae group genomosp. 3]RMO97361.1 Peptidase C55 [Pseudomonas syringae pv. philadelphi]
MGICISKPPTLDMHYQANNEQSENVTASSSPPHSPTQEIDPYASSFSQLPPRAYSKARALADALRLANNINPELAHYAQRVLATVANSQPTREISNLDAKNLATLVRTYNAKYPGLNLQYARTPREFRNALAGTDEASWRSIAILHSRGSHRVAIDVRTHDDGHKSLLVMETGAAFKRDENDEALLQFGYSEFIEDLKHEFGSNASMAVIDVRAQKSHIGCQPFCFDFALNAFHKSYLFDDLHQRLHDHGQCTTRRDEAEFIDGMEYISGAKILPAVFYKHAESRATIDTVLREQPAIASKDVSTHRGGPTETLQERVQAFRIQRDKITYSMSIEASRIRKIREAIENDHE